MVSWDNLVLRVHVYLQENWFLYFHVANCLPLAAESVYDLQLWAHDSSFFPHLRQRGMQRGWGGAGAGTGEMAQLVKTLATEAWQPEFDPEPK